MEIYFVSNNQHKLAEVQALCGPDISLKNLNDLGWTEEIPETGATFEANASQKSHYIFSRYRVNCFADDSVLEVDALHGEPGVDSAHYSGSRDAESNLQLVLDKLAGTSSRKARFRTVISLILDGEEYFFEGVAEGGISSNKTGKDGFGYDPIFVPEGYDRSFAEMTMEEKNQISHRAKAMQKLIAFLKERSR